MLLVQSWFRFSPHKILIPKSPMEEDEHEDQSIPPQDESPSIPNYADEFDLQPHNEIKLSFAGKQISKIVKHLDKSNNYMWEEDKDPYAVHFCTDF